MNIQPILTNNSQWVEAYPTGYINIHSNKLKDFKPDVLKYNYTIDSTHAILKQGDNSKIEMPQLSSQEKKLKPTKALTYEGFSGNNLYFQHKETFSLPTNMVSHINPIWVIIAFLIAIWIIYFLAK